MMIAVVTVSYMLQSERLQGSTHEKMYSGIDGAEFRSASIFSPPARAR